VGTRPARLPRATGRSGRQNDLEAEAEDDGSGRREDDPKGQQAPAMGKTAREAAAGAGVRAGLARKARVEAIPF